MNDDAQELAALLASRLNHDYVAPLTAISNSCELMALSPMNAKDCIDLIAESVQSAISLLQFYRIAFGYYDPSEEMSFYQFQRTTSDLIDDKLTQLSFDVQAESFLRSEAMMIALVFLSVRSTFSKLTAFSLKKEGENWEILAKGDGFQEKTGEYRCEKHWIGAQKVTSSEVHFPILLRHLKHTGYALSREWSEDHELRIKLSPEAA